MKKLFAVLLAVAMLLSLGVTAFAEESEPTSPATGTGKIQVSATAGTFKAYKIFGVSLDGTAPNQTVVYHNNTEWAEAISEAIDDGDASVKLLEIPGGDVIEADAGYSAADFAAWLKEELDDQTVAATLDTTNNFTAEDLAPGYYLIVMEDGDIAALATVIDGRTTKVENKNDMPLDKEVERGDTADGETADYADDGEGVNVGDTLNYKITGKIPSITTYTGDNNDYNYTWIVTDKMSKGLTFGNKVTIKIGGNIQIGIDNTGDVPAVTGAENIGGLTVVPSNSNMPLTGNKIRFGHKDPATEDEDDTFTFELSLDVYALRETLGGATVEITYTGTVNNEAGVELLQNKAVLTYGDSSDLHIKDAETDNYICRIVIDKFEAGNREQKLEGAKFKLYKLKDDTKTGDELHAESNRDYYTLNESTGVVTWGASGTERVTDENGYAEFPHLADGTYYLVETQAPIDYTELKGYIEVVVDGSAAADARLSYQQRVDAVTTVVNVANRPGTSMPSTGGVGATMLTIGGVALILAAGAFLVLRRRKEQE